MVEPSFISERVKQKQCPIGKQGFCCKICLMGPCIICKPDQKGVCGASQDLIVARNVLRFTAGGASAHCGHAYHVMKYLGKSYPPNYIKDKAPSYLYKLWNKLGIVPKIKFEHFKDISEAIHMTTMGVNSDYQDVLKNCMKIGIVDGYYGMYFATQLEDERLGKPKIKKGKMDLGCLDPNQVNIAVHGHEPMFASAIAVEAKKHKDVNLVGVCCTGASLLARFGVPMAANFILQETVIASGIVDAMVVDIQCIMPSLSDLCGCYHTKLITTNEIAKIPNATHLPITKEAEAQAAAKKIIAIAKDNVKNRRKDCNKLFSKQKTKSIEVTTGFSEDNINVKKLAKMVKNKEVKGIIGLVGCVNPRTPIGKWMQVFKKLKKDYIILTTGCVAFEMGKRGMMDGQRVFHLGSCVNNSRIAEVLKRVSENLNKELTELPFIITCPMPITEKSLAIGMFFAAQGVDVHYGYPFMISSDTNVAGFLANVLKDQFKSSIFLDTDPESFYNKLKNGLEVTPK